MTTNSALASKLLPVSILTGPATRQLLHDIVGSDPTCRFGLLANGAKESDDSSINRAIPDELIVEELTAANDHGGYNPTEVSAQISAFADKDLVDHLIVECDSRTHPIAFASLFLPQDGGGQGLAEFARLSAIVLLLDSETLLSSIVYGNHITGIASPCILADQIEVANLVVLNGELATKDFALSRAIVSAINPRTRIVPTSLAAPAGKLLDGAISFDFAMASEGAGWRKLIEGESDIKTNDQGVTAIAYRARRPFHPEKFWNLLQSRYPGVFRAKGYFWLATRMNLVGGLNIAGSECHYSPAGEWWAAVAPKGADGQLEIPDRLKKVWAEPFGDRRQALAFMGIDLDPADLRLKLDAYLLSDSEMSAGEGNWAQLPDPFPAWSGKRHDHECEDHDCCHGH